jgi:hypothetical protein
MIRHACGAFVPPGGGQRNGRGNGMRRREDSQLETARALIQRHGAQAVAVAQERATESEAQGDREGSWRWRSVQRAVEELRAGARAAG